MRRRATRWAVVMIVAAGLVASSTPAPAVPGPDDDFSAYPAGQVWAEGTTHGLWMLGSSLYAFVDYVDLAAFTDKERPYLAGLTGLYTEDADVHFDNFHLLGL